MHAEGTLLSTLAGMRTEAPALVLFDNGQQLRCWSFAQLHEATQACKRTLAGLGLQPGQQLLCVSGDCLQFFALLHASLQTGLVFVPLHADQDQATVAAALAAPNHALTLVEA
ncbi:MAG TPA: AMP-binding protein, partial [Pseudomonadaceae bacterium]|nr:AMP-binding protein [Pseudomonadaceae bacterium]